MPSRDQNRVKEIFELKDFESTAVWKTVKNY